MTASLFVTGTHVVGIGRGRPDDPLAQADVHAVAKPVVDGLELSVCGLLVSAVAGQDWPAGRAVPRCGECSRIAG
ncbi:MAG: hypothetical protein JWP33_1923 [Blastococcus sp.]|jgi:hypothetical protein|nr:hypothetical protein [Blastococcus sp.]MCW2684010.1 hypothetical protein [Blastococcus sp.]